VARIATPTTKRGAVYKDNFATDKATTVNES
jgi:hypothetical protein